MGENTVSVCVRGIDVEINRAACNDMRFVRWMHSAFKARDRGDLSGIDIFELFDYMDLVFGKEQVSRIEKALEVDGIVTVTDGISFFFEAIRSAGEQVKN